MASLDVLTNEEISDEVNRKSRNSLSMPTQSFLPDPPTTPQVYIRLCPAVYQDDISSCLVLPDGKTLELTATGQAPRQFTSDGVLQDASAENLFQAAVASVIEKAMAGVPGVVLSLASEGSGQTFTFFGDVTKYETRGILPMAFEKIFECAGLKRNETKYAVYLGVIDVRKNKVRDLISLSPYELKSVGDNGPHRMALQPIECAEQGYAYLIRALAGQRLLDQSRPYAKAHTIVFIEIEGQPILEQDQELSTANATPFKSRLTFAKIASLPQRTKDQLIRSASAQPNYRKTDHGFHSSDSEFLTPQYSSRGRSTARIRPDFEQYPDKYSCCAERSGPLSEGILIRRDMLFLGQMFTRLGELRKVQRYYHKMIFVGLNKLMRDPSKALSRYFRQSKLCHCLRDLICSNSEIRIILHLRPEAEYVPTVLEILRFIERLRLVPRYPKADLSGDKDSDLNSLRQEIQLLREELDKIANSTGARLVEEGAELSESRHALLQNQATEYLSGKLDTLEVGTKLEAKVLFEYLRTSFQDAVASRSSFQSIRSSKKTELKSNKSNSFSKESTKAAASDREITKKAKRTKSVTSKKKGKKKLESETTIPAAVPTEAVPTIVEVVEEAEKEVVEEKAPLGELEQIIDIMGFVSKAEALEQFGKTEIGSRQAEEIALNEALLEQLTQEHTAAVQNTTDFLQSLSTKQLEFEAIQLARYTKGDEYDASGNIIIDNAEKEALIELRVMEDSRKANLEKLKFVKQLLQRQKTILSSIKTEFETQFQIFCLDRFAGFTNGEEDESQTEGKFLCGHGEAGDAFCNLYNFGPNTPENLQEINKKFDLLKRTAEEQAFAIVKYYAVPPPWQKY